MWHYNFIYCYTQNLFLYLLYNINEDFITDDTFVEGAGKHYTAGTNVYFTSNDLWDCFGGSVPPTATVDEVKSYLGI